MDLRICLPALAAIAALACAHSQPVQHVSVTTRTPPCTVPEDEALESVRARCSGAEHASGADDTPALRLEVVPAAPVVVSGASATVTVRATNGAALAATIDVVCGTQTRIFDDADARVDVERAQDDGGLVCGTGHELPVVLEPGAALLVTYEVQAVQLGMRARPECADDAWSCTHASDLTAVGPIAPGSYALELQLPWRAPGTPRLATVRAPLVVAPPSAAD